MDDNKFWLCAWSLAAATLLSIVMASLAVLWHDDNLKAEIIAKAADPMAAVCAYESDSTNNNSRVPYCTLYLSGRK